MTFEQLIVDQQGIQSGNPQSKYAPPGDYSPSGEQKPSFKQKLEQAPPIPAICQTLHNAIPQSLQGLERIQFVAEAIAGLELEERVQLQSVIEHFMRYMINAGASDIDAGGPASMGSVWSRIDGEKRPRLELGRYTMDETNIFILSILSPDQLELLMNRCAVDLSYQVMAGVDNGIWHRYRVSVYFDNDGVAINVRAIANDLRPLASMGFHPTIQNGLMFDHVRDGLTLITGVTGSGKSTTLDAIVDANNSRVPGHIVIIGNPIEYIHMSKQCIVRHREVGKDVGCFHDGVVQALRQDPDIIVIGEMRDPQTISAALEVTDSGHKVFSTLHTSSAVESVARIVAEYAHEEQERVRNRLADVLRCVVSQKLLPKLGGGRVLAKEVLWVTPSVRAAIKNNNLEEIYQMMWEGRGQGQHTLEQDLFRLVKQKQIERHIAVDYANNKKRLQQLSGVF
ncbi:MAG: type IV pilus twitching motility protein PilT [Rhodothermales bacterium]